MKIAVVGAGAAGLMCAGGLAARGFDVTIFDGNEKAGKKIYITGKGRCNLTNLCPPEKFFENVVRGDKFLRSAICRFTSADAVDFFEGLGLKTKVERGNRVFPLSDKASDVTKVLEKNFCHDVKFKFFSKVVKVEKVGEKFDVFFKKTHLENGKIVVSAAEKTEKEDFDRVVIATGGKSYSATGSDGSGYALAKSFGHEIVPITAALCPIALSDDFVQKLQGVSLENVALTATADGKKMSWFGEMIFTDRGISGPIVLTASSHINRAKNVTLSLDFKPALDFETLDRRLVREFDSAKNKTLEAALCSLLPRAVAKVFAERLSLDGKKQNNSVTKAERAKIVENLKNFPLNFHGLYPIEAAVVTSGGVSTREVNPKNMESKLVSGLFFCGEVLDCDAHTGGFNLQIAWATARAVAENLS